MLRSILAVVLGYVVMSLFVMLGVVALTVLFPEYANAAETGAMPTFPIVLNLLIGTACAVLGGYVTALLAARAPRQHAYVLAGLVLAFGFMYAVMTKSGPQPTWYLWLLPPCGALGVALGGWLKDRRGCTSSLPASANHETV